MEEFEADEMIPRGYRFLSHNGMRIFKISVESYQSFRVYIQNIEADNEISVPITEEGYRKEIATAFKNLISIGSIIRVRRILDSSTAVPKPDGDIPRRHRRISL